MSNDKLLVIAKAIGKDSPVDCEGVILYLNNSLKAVVFNPPENDTQLMDVTSWLTGIGYFTHISNTVIEFSITDIDEMKRKKYESSALNLVNNILEIAFQVANELNTLDSEGVRYEG